MGEIKHKMHFCLVVSALALKAIILRAEALTTNFRVFTASYLKRSETQNYSHLKPIPCSQSLTGNMPRSQPEAGNAYWGAAASLTCVTSRLKRISRFYLETRF